MSKCINISHPEYKKLLNDSKLHPAVLKAKIAIWQDKYNTEEFPSLDELTTPIIEDKQVVQPVKQDIRSKALQSIINDYEKYASTININKEDLSSLSDDELGKLLEKICNGKKFGR